MYLCSSICGRLLARWMRTYQPYQYFARNKKDARKLWTTLHGNMHWCKEKCFCIERFQRKPGGMFQQICWNPLDASPYLNPLHLHGDTVRTSGGKKAKYVGKTSLDRKPFLGQKSNLLLLELLQNLHLWYNKVFRICEQEHAVYLSVLGW